MGESLPKITTVLPGPKSQELWKQREQYVAQGVSNAHNIFVTEAKDALVTDVDGNVFLDVAAGIGMQNAGHSDGEVVNAIAAQAKKYIHPCFHVAPYEPYVALAARLAKVYPASFPVKAMFANSGAEAVENAVKIARRFTGKSGIITLENSYHGRTLMTMGMTSKLKPYGYGFGPFAADFHKTTSAYCYRCPLGAKYPACGIACAEQLRSKLKTVLSPDLIAALIAEPVQGEGGFIVPPKEFLPALSSICKENGILFISDEVQTGYGRTGKLFAIENSSVEPDLMTLSKSIAAGLPLSAVIGKSEVMDAPFKGQIGGTFGGSPLSCAAALKVLDKMEQQNLPDRAKKIGERMMQRLCAMQEKHTAIGDVRGLGAMIGVEFVTDRTIKEADCAIIGKIIHYAFEHGVLLLSAGILSNVVRFLPPLVMTDKQVDYVMDVFDAAIASAN